MTGHLEQRTLTVRLAAGDEGRIACEHPSSADGHLCGRPANLIGVHVHDGQRLPWFLCLQHYYLAAQP